MLVGSWTLERSVKLCFDLHHYNRIEYFSMSGQSSDIGRDRADKDCDWSHIGIGGCMQHNNSRSDIDIV